MAKRKRLAHCVRVGSPDGTPRQPELFVAELRKSFAQTRA
jgi:hypothetical protein